MPDSPSGSRLHSAVVVAPGGTGLVPAGAPPGSRDGLVQLCRCFARAGFLTFAFDGRGQGGNHPSFPRSEGQRCTQFDLVYDLRAALDYLMSSNTAEPTSIGIFGQSVGGAAALALAKTDPRIRAVATWGTALSYRELIASGVVDPAVTGVDPAAPTLELRAVLSRIECPVLIGGSAGDPISQSLLATAGLNAILREGQSVVWVTLPGRAHRLDLSTPGFSLVEGLVSTWFLQHLPG